MKINVKKIHHFTGHRDSVYALARGEEDHKFYSAGGDGMVVMWDMKKKSDGQVIAKVDGSIYAMSFHKGKRLLIIGQNNDGLHFVDPQQKKSVKSLKITDSIIFDTV